MIYLKYLLCAHGNVPEKKRNLTKPTQEYNEAARESEERGGGKGEAKIKSSFYEQAGINWGRMQMGDADLDKRWQVQ